MVEILCPRCVARTHRSRTRGLNEKLVKALTSYEPYRCQECGWRGWLRNNDPLRQRHALRTVISVLITLVITTLLALYLIEKLRTN